MNELLGGNLLAQPKRTSGHPVAISVRAAVRLTVGGIDLICKIQERLSIQMLSGQQ